MAEVLNVSITTNVSEFPYEKKFSANTSLHELKKKLMPIVGASQEQIGVELRDRDGRFVASLTDDTATLAQLGVRDGMQLHATDISGENVQLQDASMVEKYEISDASYAQRGDSARAFKLKMQADPTYQQRQQQEEERLAASLKVGSRCLVRVGGGEPRHGSIAFVGRTQFKDGIWVGIHYDKPVGKNDGSVAGVRYFECADKFGGFVRPCDVSAELSRPVEDAPMDEI